MPKQEVMMAYCSNMIYQLNKNCIANPLILDDIVLRQLTEVGYEKSGKVSEHVQPHNEISYILSGKGVFVTDGKREAVSAGDIHIIPKGKMHTVYADNEEKLRFVCIGFDFVKNTDSSSAEIQRFFSEYNGSVLHDSGSIRFVIEMLIEEAYSEEENSIIIYETCMKQLLVLVQRLARMKNKKYFTEARGTTIEQQTAYNMVRYIDSNLSQIRNISDVAGGMGYSLHYISHLFTQKMGMTMKSYINLRKVEVAKVLLKTKKTTVTEIAESLCFDSPQYFSKIFRKYTGMSPVEFKNS